MLLDRVVHFVHADAARGQLVRIELHANGVLLRAEHVHLRDAVDRGDALRDQGLGILVDNLRRHRRRGEAHEQNRLVGRIHLLHRGRRRHVGGSLRSTAAMAACTSGRGRVDIALQRKLKRDVGLPAAAGRGHRIETGDGRELAFQRRGDRSRHGFRTGAGQLRLHLQGGEVDVGRSLTGSAR